MDWKLVMNLAQHSALPQTPRPPYLYELAEIHPFVSDIVEDSLRPVSLELHVAYLHVQSEVGGDLSRPYHSAVLPGYGFLPFLQIQLAGLPVYLLEFLGLHVKMVPGHLSADHRTAQGYDAYVMSGGSLYHDKIAGFQKQVGSVLIESLSGILETYFVYVVELRVGDALQPVEVGQFAAAPAVIADKFPVFGSFCDTSPGTVVCCVFFFHIVDKLQR